MKKADNFNPGTWLVEINDEGIWLSQIPFVYLPHDEKDGENRTNNT
jgi:hypothetical protein